MDVYQLASLFLFSVLAFHSTCQPPDDAANNMKQHLRRKRYIVFPEGSTFSIAFCIQWGLLNRDLNIFTSSVNWAISYDLPNETIRSPDKRLVVPYILRRHRRELYKRLEVAMDSAGLDGRTCIKRALCEASQRLKSKESFSQEMLRVIFALPLDKVDIYEPPEHHVYDAAYRRGLSNHDCPDLYSTCPFSLIDIFLGTPNTNSCGGHNLLI